MNAFVINYQIEFFSYWHCGSGLAAGADMDALVIKDKRNNLPFIPGKTIKGLVRQAIEDIQIMDGNNSNVLSLFGKEGQESSPLYFSNATLIDANEIIEFNLQSHLFSAISNTAVEDSGIAKDGSLRRTEVVIPCILSGLIFGIPTEEARNSIIQSLSYIKSIGLHRNRGFGRCIITVKED